VSFGGHDTALEFREKIEAPWFRYWLHGKGEKFPWKASTFQTGSNSWKTYAAWPPKATTTSVYLHRDGCCRSTRRRRATVTCSTCPTRRTRCRIGHVRFRRPILPATGGDGRSAISGSSRTVRRGDVGEPSLDRDLTVTGEAGANLVASTSGTDSDFVVKLIDVYPENAQAERLGRQRGPQPGQYAQSLNGYELPIAMEVRRGRYNKSYEHPQPLVANQPTEIRIPLRSHDHVFLKGHRLMVQVQSTWFP
jgi:putative CocE/NonD family hydrolase